MSLGIFGMTTAGKSNVYHMLTQHKCLPVSAVPHFYVEIGDSILHHTLPPSQARLVLLVGLQEWITVHNVGLYLWLCNPARKLHHNCNRNIFRF